jgi:hypothetical protein
VRDGRDMELLQSDLLYGCSAVSAAGEWQVLPLLTEALPL